MIEIGTPYCVRTVRTTTTFLCETVLCEGYGSFKDADESVFFSKTIHLDPAWVLIDTSTVFCSIWDATYVHVDDEKGFGVYRIQSARLITLVGKLDSVRRHANNNHASSRGTCMHGKNLVYHASQHLSHTNIRTPLEEKRIHSRLETRFKKYYSIRSSQNDWALDVSIVLWK